MARDYADILNGTFGEEHVAPVTGLSFIFGSGVRLLDDSESRTERRVVVYPCTGDIAHREVAQGLMCVLTWTLNGLDGVTAMPLLVREPSTLWSPENSNFTPEEFSLDTLGEDTVITGILTQENAQFTLAISATSDLDEAEDLSIVVHGVDQTELLNAVIGATSRIGLWLRGDAIDPVGPGQVVGNGVATRNWLTSAFALHRSALSAALVGEQFDFETSAVRDATVEAAHNDITGLTVRGIALVLGWVQKIGVEGLVESIRSLPHWSGAAGSFARALIQIGETRRALEILEQAVELAPEIPGNWLVLARLYLAASQPHMAIEALQEGIETSKANAPLLMQYGEVLINHADQNYSLDEVILIDEGFDPAAAFEGIAAYEEAVRVLSGEQQAMAYVQLVGALSRYNPKHVWTAFEALAVSDLTGTYTELALNIVSSQEDIENALTSLNEATGRFPHSGRIWRNLAYAQYLVGDMEGAGASVKNALEHVVEAKARGEFELLALYIQDNTIEGQLAEIADGLSVGGEVSDKTLEFLERVVGDAPNYAEGYLLLGRAYVAGGEAETALEVLLDAESTLDGDVDIIVAIIDILMSSGDDSVALDYVTKGIERFPRHIPLLARAALVTNALGDSEGAKAFLRQAHNIVPYHREIMRISQQIQHGND